MRNLLFALLLCLGLPTFVVAQTDGRGALTAFLEENLSSAGRTVTVTGFRGAFSSRAEIESLTIADDEGIWLTLNGVVLDWSRAALLLGRVEINELVAEEVIVTRAPVAAESAVPSPESKGFSLPDLPVSVSVDRLAAARISLGEALLGQAVEGSLESALQLAGGEGRADLTLTRIGTGPSGTISLKASYANVSEALLIDLVVAEGPGGIAATLMGLPGQPDVALTINGQGPLDDFVAEIDLKTDGEQRLAGQVTLTGTTDGTQSFAADLGGDLAPLFLPDYAEFFGPDVRIAAEGQRNSAGKLDLNALRIQAQALSLDGSAVIAADGLPQRIDLAGRLGVPSGEPVLLPLSGDIETRVASADLRLNFDASQDEGWSGAVSLTGLSRSDISIEAAQITGSGRINRRTASAGGAVLGGTFKFETTGVVPADDALAAALGRDVTGSATLDWQQGGLGLRIGRLELSGQGYGLQTSGRVGDLASGFRLTGKLAAQYDDLSRLSGLASRPLAGAAKLTADGTISPLGGDFDGEASIEGVNIETGMVEVDQLLRGTTTIDLSIKRDETGTVLRVFELAARQLVASASGSLATAGSDLTANINFSDLSILGAGYRGSLRADASLTGTVDDGRMTLDGLARDLAVNQPQADGLLAGESVVAIDVAFKDGRYQFQKANIANPQLTAKVLGYYDPTGSDLTAEVAMPSLAVIGPQYQGSLNAQATAQGTPESGRVTLDGTGRDLKVGQTQVGATLSGESILSAAVSIKGGRYDIETAKIANPQIKAQAMGYYDPLGSDLIADVTFADLSVVGPGYGGSLQADVRAEGTVDEGRLVLNGLGQNVAVGRAEANRLLEGTSNITATVNLKNRQLVIESAKLTNPQVNASVSGSVTESLRQVAFEAQLANMAVLVPEFPGSLRLSGNAKEDISGFALDVSGQGPGGIDARVSGRLAPGLRSADLAINGSAQAALANAFLNNRSITGQTRFDLQLNGPLVLSSLSGNVTLAGGRFSDPTLPFGLQDISASANLGGSSARVNVETVASSGGRIVVQGSMGLAAPFNGDLEVGIRSLTVRDPDLYETVASGTVTLKGPLSGGAMIAGLITIGETELRVPSTGLGGVGSIPDLKHVNEPAAVRRTRANAGLLDDGSQSVGGGGARSYGLNLRIQAPARIFMRGRGLDAELGGSATLRGTTDNVIPSGGFELIRGRLEILGKRLDLTSASLLLQGDLVPYLNIVASNESDGITSSIVIFGRADEPEISFTSNPELPEEEVLARLLFGRGLDNISPLQAAQLASAVATLAGRGGDGIVGNLRKGFGLDDLDLATDAEGNATLRAGKYISRNAYTEIEVGQDGQSKINLNLDIRKGVKLRGSVGADGDTGIGIFVEKDY